MSFSQRWPEVGMQKRWVIYFQTLKTSFSFLLYKETSVCKHLYYLHEKESGNSGRNFAYVFIPDRKRNMTI